jgi:hypothetical protein
MIIMMIKVVAKVTIVIINMMMVNNLNDMMFLFKLKYHWRAIKESASSLQKLNDHNQLFLLPHTTPGKLQ